MQRTHNSSSVKRPIGVIIVGIFFILSGIVGTIYHAMELNDPDHSLPTTLWILSLRILLIICGWLLLRGAGWARWVALAWMAYHVVIGALHSMSDAFTHVAILVILVLLLFNRKSNEYFRVDLS